MESMPETAVQNHKQKPGGTLVSNCSTQQPSTPISPPYWQQQRSISHVSADSRAHAPPISLEDHTEVYNDANCALWAKDITIEDYVIVRGGSAGVGAYVVWNCRVQTLDVRRLDSKWDCKKRLLTSFLKGGPMIIRKRYADT